MRWFCALVCLLVAAGGRAEDRLVTREGEVVEGRLVSWNRDEVVIETEAGPRTIATAELASIRLEGASVLAVGARLPAPEPSPPPVLWSGEADASFSGKRGTTSADSLGVTFAAERRSEIHRLRFGSQYFYATQEDLLTANRLLANGRWDRFVSDRAFYFASGDFETNEVERVDLRLTVAGGLGVDLERRDDRRLSVSVGGGLTREDFTDGTRRAAASLVATEELRLGLGGPAELEQKLRYLQDLAAAGRWKLRAEAVLRIRLNELLAFRVGIVDAFDHRPPAGARRNELTLLTGVGFAF